MKKKMTNQLLDPQEVDLRLDECGYLEGKLAGRQIREATAREAFPFSMPGEYVELSNSEGRRLGFIRRLDELPPEVRKAVRKSLRLQHLTPLVKRILSIKGQRHIYEWRVLTDRGKAGFHTRGRRQNIAEIAGDEYLVTDTEGNRYRIPKVPDLDARSLVNLHKVL